MIHMHIIFKMFVDSWLHFNNNNNITTIII